MQSQQVAELKSQTERLFQGALAEVTSGLHLGVYQSLKGRGLTMGSAATAIESANVSRRQVGVFALDFDQVFEDGKFVVARDVLNTVPYFEIDGFGLVGAQLAVGSDPSGSGDDGVFGANCLVRVRVLDSEFPAPCAAYVAGQGVDGMSDSIVDSISKAVMRRASGR
ncbi:MAG: hypothetical protein KF871_04680 [Hydrogenophaga sp.]|uniref:hypothetical protein n=1 Tax=Hydrogenophaga sp. TaxID=1904254 RepID=UPI001DDA7E98|nr:hypothetical protein [Hydrogenophaga sp.]MBX3609171.1 hypothetical protein [Hydrogenophaga sp.]